LCASRSGVAGGKRNDPAFVCSPGIDKYPEIAYINGKNNSIVSITIRQEQGWQQDQAVREIII